jgi:FkbM family methyltransferase
MKPHSIRTKFLNFFRRVFQWAPCERWLARMVQDHPPECGLSKLVPNPYQYPSPSLRKFERNGIHMIVDISDYIGHYLYFGFEDASLRKLFSLCAPDAHVLDIGTNIGWTAINLAQRTKGRVVGFEPDPLNFGRCQENMNLNFLPNLVVLPIGVGRTRSRAALEVRTPENRGGNRIAPNGGLHATSIDMLPLDLVPEVLALPSVDLIKIDVEGYEMEVLLGAQEILTYHRPILFIEVDDQNLRAQKSSARALVLFLEQMGYQNRDATDDKSIRSIDDFANCHFDLIALPKA